jgi:hypothetical protein
VLEGTTKIILPFDKMIVNRNPFPLENRLRQLKVVEYCYIIGIFDCCRQMFSFEKDAVRAN